MRHIFKLLPFWVWPGSWGLRGKTRQMAEIEYYYDGEERDRRLAMLEAEGRPDDLAIRIVGIDLKYGRIDQYAHDTRVAEIQYKGETERKLALLEIDLRHGKIDQYTYDRSVVETRGGTPEEVAKALLEVEARHNRLSDYEQDRQRVVLSVPEGGERDLELAAVDLRHGKITQVQHDKAVATAHGEPYVGIVDSSYDSRQGVNGLYFEFDWNEAFIDLLREKGYGGGSDEQIVNEWFNHLCQSIAEEAIEGATEDGVTSFTQAVRLDRDRVEHR